MNLGRLSHQARNTILGDVLLKRFFFKLFLHWNAEVRRLFAFILVYRVQRSTFAAQIKLNLDRLQTVANVEMIESVQQTR